MKKSSPKKHNLLRKKQKKIKTAAEKRAATLRLKARKERELKAKRHAAAVKGWQTRKDNLAKKQAKKQSKKPTKKPAKKPSRRPKKPTKAEVQKAYKKFVEAQAEEKLFQDTLIPDSITVEHVIDYLTRRLESFSKDNNYESTIHSTILADGTIAVETTFLTQDMSVKDIDDLLANLSVEVQSWGPDYKTSIALAVDPSKIVRQHEHAAADTIDVVGSRYDFYKGMLDVPTNLSSHAVGQFANVRFSMLPALKETTGQAPTSIRLIVLHGESIMGSAVSRKVTHMLDLFE